MVRIAAFQAAGPGSIPGGCTYIDGQKSDPIFFLVWGVNFLDSSGLELDDLRYRKDSHPVDGPGSIGC